MAKDRGQDLDRHAQAQLQVLTQVDLGHATGADAVQDFVVADPEAARFAANEQVGLKTREQPVAYEKVGQRTGSSGRPDPRWSR